MHDHSPISLGDQKKQIIADKLVRELGPSLMRALADPTVVEILLNPDGRLWFDVLGGGMRDTGEKMSPGKAENLLGTIAAMLETTIDHDRPFLQGELPLDGSRVQGVIRPIVSNPSFSIRKKALLVYSLDDYVTSGMLDERHAIVLRQAVHERQNILIVGSTGSGKTTFANALLDEMSRCAGQNQRIVMIEDTVELQCAAPNVVAMRTSDTVDMNGCLRITMRMRPDRIVVGEVRDSAALTLLKAWNTGHPGGLCTVHANSAAAGLLRLEQLIAEEKNTQPQPSLIAEAVHVIAFIKRTETSRRVTELLKCLGHDGSKYVLETIAGSDPPPDIELEHD